MTAAADPHREVLERVLVAVRGRLRRKQFDTWFARTTLLDLSAETLVLGVPNDFLAEWMNREYVTTVTAAAREAIGRPVAVRFQVDGAARRAPARAEPAAPQSSATAGGPALGPQPAASTPPGPAAGPSLFMPRAAPPPPPPYGRPTVIAALPGSDLPPIVLQPLYTFDQFVVGPSNQLAHAVARAVADRPGDGNNPLFLHGSVGLGKTHLLQAICAEALRRRPDLRVAYLSCEQFTNEYVSAVTRNATEAFRARFRNVDMLVVDDIHFLANKERTQEELFHTFNALHQQRKQLIFSSDAPPNDIPSLEERLVSRFRWGVVAPLAAPELETRMAILRRKAESVGLVVPDDVVAYVADVVRSNIRELEGAIASLRTRSTLEEAPVDLALAHTALEPLRRIEHAPLTLDRIATVVATHYGLKLADLRSLKRTKSVSLPRQIAMFLGREETGQSLVELGGFFGGRDHTTVLYAVDKVASRVVIDEAFRQTVDRLRDRIRQR